MPGLLDARGGFDDPITMGLLGASQALLTPMSQGGGLGAAFGAFPAAQQAAEATRYRQMLQAYQMRKMQQEEEDRQAARDMDAQIKAAARNSFGQLTPGSLGGGIAPGSQQGRMLLESMSGDPEFDKANLGAINSAANTVGPQQEVSAPTFGFDQNKFFNELVQVSPLKAMELRKSLQADSPWAKINPGEYTPDSVAAFAASNNPAVLRKATDVNQLETRDTGTTIEYFPKGRPEQVVHRVPKQFPPNFQPIAREGGGIAVVNSRDGVVQDAVTTSGAPVPKPLKDIPQTVANGYMENQVAIDKISQAIEEARKNPNAFGVKNYGPDALTQRLDQEGVVARAMVADIASLKIHDRSGAAVSAAEFPRLRPFVPLATDNPQVVVKKLELFKKEYEAMQQGIDTFYGDGGYKPPPRMQAPPPAAQPAPSRTPQAQPTPVPQPQPTKPSGLGTPTVSGQVLGPKPIATQADVDVTFASMRKANPNITRQQVIDLLSQTYRVQ